MLKILFVIPSLEFGGTAKQLILLATHLPRDRFEIQICILGTAGRWRSLLESKNIRYEALNWTRMIDPAALFKLRRVIQSFQPQIVHSWTRPALRASWATSPGLKASFVASACADLGKPFVASRLLRKAFLSKARKVVSSGDKEARQFESLALGQRVASIPMGVEVDENVNAKTQGLREELNLTPTAKVLLCAGPLTMNKGHQEAIWALDILHFLYEDLHLVIVGEGPDLPRLKHFAQATGGHERVHFLGKVPNVPQLLSEVDVAWIPSRSDTGRNFLLETMASGKPFVAARLPSLIELVPKELEEYLVKAGDKGALARQTRVLLDDANLRSRLGEIGQVHVRDRFSVAALANNFAKLYESIDL